MNPSVVSGDHADVHMERTAVRWLAELVGYPHAPGGGPAHERGVRRDDRLPRRGPCPRRRGGRPRRAPGRARGRPAPLVYVPSEAHSCVSRAIELLGLGSGVDPAGAALRRASRPGRAARRDRGGPRGGRDAGRSWSARREPSTRARSIRSRRSPTSPPPRGCGSTSTGPMAPSACSIPAIASRYRGMERADSLTLDPHKWLGVPVDAGCVLVRHAGRAAGGVQHRAAVPAPGRRRGAGHLRRVRHGADAAVPSAEDVGDDRGPRSHRHRRPGRPRERAGARARRADRAGALAGARGRPGDVDRGVQGAAARLRRRTGSRTSTALCPRPSRRAGGSS